MNGIRALTNEVNGVWFSLSLHEDAARGTICEVDPEPSPDTESTGA